MNRDTGNIFDTLIMVAIAVGLAYAAFETGWHAALFGFMTFVAYSVGNRVCGDLNRIRHEMRERDRLI